MLASGKEARKLEMEGEIVIGGKILGEGESRRRSGEEVGNYVFSRSKNVPIGRRSDWPSVSCRVARGVCRSAARPRKIRY